jgi:acetylornithine deacetylase/succinyl-diaminopimelate desuccinylase-like protein
VVPPGEGWTKDPYGAEIEDGKLYGRAAAVSKSDFASFTFAVRALEAVAKPSKGAVELHYTYDEEFGGIMGPGWLLEKGLTKPDLMIAAGFSYEVVTAHNGCLQMEITVQGKMAHAAVPHTGVDALQATAVLLTALYAENVKYKQVTSKVPGIKHPYLNIGRIDGGTNTNVVPGKVMLKIDRRMIPEENPVEVEASIRAVIAKAIADFNTQGGYTGEDAVRVDIKRLLLANAMTPLDGNKPWSTPSRPTAKPSSAKASRSGHASVHRRAPVCRARHPRRDLRRRPPHRAGIARQALRRAPGAGRPAPCHQGGGPLAGGPDCLSTKHRLNA